MDNSTYADLLAKWQAVDNHTKTFLLAHLECFGGSCSPEELRKYLDFYEALSKAVIKEIIE
jgi:hypothetical protein